MHGYNHTRNIHKINNKWVIRKSIKNKRKTYGTYQTINEAQKIRDKLIFHNWNPEFAGLSFKRRGKENPNRYITVQGGKFRIMKDNPNTGKKEIYDSGIPTLHEAREIRDGWERVGWNWELI
jgi:hypothetical protein